MSTKITALSAASTIVDADLFVTVTDVATTPDSKKTTIGTLFTGRKHTGTLTLDNNTAAAAAIDIDGPVNTTVPVIQCNDADALTTAGFFNFVSDAPDALSNRSLGTIHNNNSLAVKATCLTLVQDADQRALFIDMNGNDAAIEIDGENTTADALEVACNVLTTGKCADFNSTSVDASTRDIARMFNVSPAAIGTTCLTLRQEAAQRALFIDMNGVTGNGIVIVQDSNDAGDVYAMSIESDNAGAGGPGGIDFSTFTADEPLFKFVNDAVTSLGTLTKQAAVDVGGTTYYIPLYTTGT